MCLRKLSRKDSRTQADRAQSFDTQYCYATLDDHLVCAKMPATNTCDGPNDHHDPCIDFEFDTADSVHHSEDSSSSSSNSYSSPHSPPPFISAATMSVWFNQDFEEPMAFDEEAPTSIDQNGTFPDDLTDIHDKSTMTDNDTILPKEILGHGNGIQCMRRSEFVCAVHDYIDHLVSIEYANQMAPNGASIMHEQVFHDLVRNEWMSLGFAPDATTSTTPPKVEMPMNGDCVCAKCNKKIAHDERLPLLECAHVACEDCWTSAMLTFLHTTHTQTRMNPFSATCPCEGCNTKMSTTLFRSLVLQDPFLRSQYETAFMRCFSASNANPHFRQCPNLDCSAIAYSRDPPAVLTSRAVNCICNHRWCITCTSFGLGTHYPLSCEQIAVMASYGSHLLGVGAVRMCGLVDIAAHVLQKFVDSTHQPFGCPLSRSLIGTSQVDVFDSLDAKQCAGCSLWTFKPHTDRRVVYCGNDCTAGCGLIFCWFCGWSFDKYYSKDATEHNCVAGTDTYEYIAAKKLDDEEIGQCPRCHTGIQKVSGCSEVKCACRFLFCWLCGVEMKSSLQHQCQDEDKLKYRISKQKTLAELSIKLDNWVSPLFNQFSDIHLKFRQLRPSVSAPTLTDGAFVQALLCGVEFCYWSKVYINIRAQDNQQPSATMLSFLLRRDTLQKICDEITSLLATGFLKGSKSAICIDSELRLMRSYHTLTKSLATTIASFIEL